MALTELILVWLDRSWPGLCSREKIHRLFLKLRAAGLAQVLGPAVRGAQRCGEAGGRSFGTVGLRLVALERGRCGACGSVGRVSWRGRGRPLRQTLSRAGAQATADALPGPAPHLAHSPAGGRWGGGEVVGAVGGGWQQLSVDLFAFALSLSLSAVCALLSGCVSLRLSRHAAARQRQRAAAAAGGSGRRQGARGS